MQKLFIIFFVSICLLLPRSLALADETVDNLQSKIDEYNRKITELSKAKDTLANQITILNSQIDLTLLKINQTQLSIKTLEKEINILSDKINVLDVSLNQLSSIYINQVISSYKMQKRFIPLTQLLSGDFNGFLNQYKYVSSVQKNSQNNLLNLETIRTNYDMQKSEKEKKQQELSALQKKLSEQQANLSKQKSTKANLLEVTRSDETRYQTLKKAAEDELSSLLKAKFVGKRTVKKGEAVGLMGNTGYSFGDHLHFGLYNLKESELGSWSYQNDIDASSYLRDYQLPMNNPTVTQERGHTKYAYLYADRFHHGIDYVSDNKTIMSVNDGVAYFFRNPSSSLGNHVKIFHSDGKMTLYLHLQ